MVTYYTLIFSVLVLFTTSMTVFNYCSLHETTLLRPAAYAGELT